MTATKRTQTRSAAPGLRLSRKALRTYGRIPTSRITEGTHRLSRAITLTCSQEAT